MMHLKTLAGVLFGLVFAFTSSAQQLEVDLVGGTTTALPIAVVPMRYQGIGEVPGTDIAAVVRADLNRSGRFRTLPEADLIEHPTRASEVDFAIWQVLKQDYLLVGRIFDAGVAESYRIEYELFDVARRERLLGQAMTAHTSALRDVSHQMADAVFEAVTGLRGAFWTRIAYITASHSREGERYALVVADSDGYNPQVVVRSAQPMLSPAWSPDGRKLAYVNFERGNSEVYIQDLASGERERVSGFRGINSAPAFSPDGSKLALTLSRSGNPEIYVLDLVSKALTQLTHQYGIDTSPAWSPDGESIYFTSDRSGQPQIYQVPVTGGSATRVSFEGRYNADATVSFDGKRIAVTQGEGNVYRIALLDRSFEPAHWFLITPGALDESPSFAPNAAMLVYAARDAGRGVLYAISADGRVRHRLALADGDVREPAWGPYRSQR